MAICAVSCFGRIWGSGLKQPILPPDVSVQQQSVLFLNVPMRLFTSSQFYTRRCLSYSSLCCTYRCVCLQEPVLHLYVSVFNGIVKHLDVSVYKSLGCTCTCVFCAAPGPAYLLEPVLHCICTVFTVQELCAHGAPGAVWLTNFGLFRVLNIIFLMLYEYFVS